MTKYDQWSPRILAYLESRPAGTAYSSSEINLALGARGTNFTSICHTMAMNGLIRKFLLMTDLEKLDVPDAHVQNVYQALGKLKITS